MHIVMLNFYRKICYIGILQEASKLDIQTTLVQTQLCANETSTGPLPMSLTWGCQQLVRSGLPWCFKREKKWLPLDGQDHI
jgi:hypothetical protein